MYPFTRFLMSYKADIPKEKLGFLILDVKGNYYEQVLQYAKAFNRLDDIIVIEVGGKYTYNPLYKPNLKPLVLANQLKSILLLFSPNNSESYWLDKAETVLSESLKLCKYYTDNYPTFTEIHRLISSRAYFLEIKDKIREKFFNNSISKDDYYDLITAFDFFDNEFYSLDERNMNILKSEITRITNPFISDKDIEKTFCPSKENLVFKGFSDVINEGKIVVLNMNINEYRNLSKIIAAYLKIDFQTEVMSRLSNKPSYMRPVCFISDEYSEYVTINDANFFSQSREAKCINIIATQSYTSILNTLNNKNASNVIIQNLVNKLWFRSDDIFTIETAQKQIGKTSKKRESHTISEGSRETNFNYITNSLNSRNSSISESINTYEQFDYIYDTNFFTQNLETFEALGFISTGTKILPPTKIHLIPYFKQKGD